MSICIIRFYSPYLKKVLEKRFLSANTNNSHLTHPLVPCTSKLFLWKRKKLECSYCFLSSRLQCEDYYCTVYCTIYPWTCQQGKIALVLIWQKRRPQFPADYCHKEHSPNKTQNCGLLDCLAQKGTGSLVTGNAFKMTAACRSDRLTVFISITQQPLVGQGLLVIKASHSVGLLSTSDRPGAEDSTDNTRHSQETDIHTIGGIRTLKPSKRAAANPRLEPRGYWDRHSVIYSTGNRRRVSWALKVQRADRKWLTKVGSINTVLSIQKFT
jgi:hypothetical protein